MVQEPTRCQPPVAVEASTVQRCCGNPQKEHLPHPPISHISGKSSLLVDGAHWAISAGTASGIEDNRAASRHKLFPSARLYLQTLCQLGCQVGHNAPMKESEGTASEGDSTAATNPSAAAQNTPSTGDTDHPTEVVLTTGRGVSEQASTRSPIWVAFEPKWLRRSVIAIVLILIATQMGLWVFHATANFLFLLLLAWLFGIALEPIVGFLARRGIRRGMGTGIAMLVFLIAGVVFLYVFGGLLLAQMSQLIASLPNLIDQAADWASETFQRDIDPNAIAEQLNISTSQMTAWASNLAGGVFGILSTTLGLVFQLFTLLLFAFYFSADGPRLRRTVASWLPPQRQRVFATVWDITVQKTGAFVVSRLLLAALSAFFMSIFLLVIGVPYWLPLGLFTGVVSQFIPTIGTYLGILLPALVAVFNDPVDVVWIVIFGTVYQQVENYFLSPRISAATLDIHPAIAFGSVIVGAALFGAMGAIIAIPIAAAITAILDTYGQRHELIPELADTDPKFKSRQEKRQAAQSLPTSDYERLSDLP